MFSTKLLQSYDSPLDLTTKNSTSTIISHIKPNSKVLELGCSTGKLTKFLHENLQCQVSIVEINGVDGFIAKQYAYDSLIGSDEGDVNKNIWLSKWNNERFDYIIVADLLEHLIYPNVLLTDCQSLLKDGGRILISVPNIAHNSIIIDLLNDKFQYRDTGILDRTHLRFFSRNTLMELVESCGLEVIKEDNLINIVSNTEFGNSYNDVNAILGEQLYKRKDGEVYQFVWQLIKKKYVRS